MADAPRVPAATATSCAAATSTGWWPTNAVAAGATLLAGHRGDRAGRSTAGSCAGAVVQTDRRGVARRACGPATSWWPTAPTAASAGPSARSAPRSGPTARPSARTGRRPATPSRGSSRRSTSRTATATRCPATAGSSRSATARVNIGVGLLSTFRDFKSVNTTHLLDAYAPPGRRALGDRRRPTRSAGPTSGRIPMGGSVGPKAGPTYLVVGDAAGTRQPVQRRGHRLRLRDRPHGRRRAPRGAGRPRPARAAALPEARSTTSTASTSRSPACSPGSSAGRR